jgi:hypothetical protein
MIGSDPERIATTPRSGRTQARLGVVFLSMGIPILPDPQTFSSSCLTSRRGTD